MFDQMLTKRSESSNSNGFRRNVSTALKMAALAPIPRARDVTDAAVRRGLERSERNAKRRSWRRRSTVSLISGDWDNHSYERQGLRVSRGLPETTFPGAP